MGDDFVLNRFALQISDSGNFLHYFVNIVSN